MYNHHITWRHQSISAQLTSLVHTLNCLGWLIMQPCTCAIMVYLLTEFI